MDAERAAALRHKIQLSGYLDAAISSLADDLINSHIVLELNSSPGIDSVIMAALESGEDGRSISKRLAVPYHRVRAIKTRAVGVLTAQERNERNAQVVALKEAGGTWRDIERLTGIRMENARKIYRESRRVKAEFGEHLDD